MPSYETSLTLTLRSVEAGIKTEYHTFYRRAEDIKRALEDKSEAEKEILALKTSGYLSEDNKLTRKGLGIVT